MDYHTFYLKFRKYFDLEIKSFSFAHNPVSILYNINNTG